MDRALAVCLPGSFIPDRLCADRIELNSFDEVEICLPRANELVTLCRHHGVVLGHHRDFLAAPFRDRCRGVEFDRHIRAIQDLAHPAAHVPAKVDRRAEAMSLKTDRVRIDHRLDALLFGLGDGSLVNLCACHPGPGDREDNVLQLVCVLESGG